MPGKAFEWIASAIVEDFPILDQEEFVGSNTEQWKSLLIERPAELVAV